MNSETRNKLRKLQKTFYAGMKMADFFLNISKTPMYFAAEYLSLGAIGEIQRIPWQVFCIDKPEINEHRAKAFNRLESYKRKKDIASGKVVVIASIDDRQMFNRENNIVISANI